uniref:insulin-like growth factor-binding protein complex acid labile subunit n=1 Tax=Styela clava TaxID=7725 RepID=UPI0019393FCF|nr:insulin-like growth factor-binding protein complex acid labile subunit [Styela clava]
MCKRLYVLFALLISCIKEVYLCPGKCTCTDISTNCSGTGLTSFPADLPESTIRIELRYNNISSIVEDDFKGLKNLISLDLRFNKLKNIGDEALFILDNLEILNLDHNELLMSDAGMFVYVEYSLINLTVSHNEMAGQLSRDIFQYMSKLKYLDLSFNSIKSIQSRSFPESLTYLDLSNNPIASMAIGVFRDLENLVYLDMRETQLKSVANYFADCISLHTLLLGGYNLASMSQESLQGLHNLATLSLEYTSLHILPDNVFLPTPNLNVLRLEGNKKLTITTNIISPLTNLTVLYFEDNGFIDLSFVNVLRTLEALFISGNSLTSIPALGNLKILKILDISRNVVKRLSLDWPLNELEMLNLSSNSISDVDKSFFSKLPGLRSVDLTSNVLTHLVSSWFVKNDKLKEIITGNNPWTCDCLMKEIHGYQQISKFYAICDAIGSFIKGGIVSTETFCIRCQSPFQYKGIYFDMVPSEHFESCSDNNANLLTTGNLLNSTFKPTVDYQASQQVINSLIPIICTLVMLSMLGGIAYFIKKKDMRKTSNDAPPLPKPRTITNSTNLPVDDGFEQSYAMADLGKSNNLNSAIYNECDFNMTKFNQSYEHDTAPSCENIYEPIDFRIPQTTCKNSKCDVSQKPLDFPTDITHTMPSVSNEYEDVPRRLNTVDYSNSNPYILPSSVPAPSSIPRAQTVLESPYLTPSLDANLYDLHAPPPPPDQDEFEHNSESAYETTPNAYLEFNAT